MTALVILTPLECHPPRVPSDTRPDSFAAEPATALWPPLGNATSQKTAPAIARRVSN